MIMHGTLHRFESADSVHAPDAESAGFFPIEYLNTLTASGLPPHELLLKEGAPIILLRMWKRNGSHVEEEAWSPRIDSITPEGLFPFQLQRRQFPVKLALRFQSTNHRGRVTEEQEYTCMSP